MREAFHVSSQSTEIVQILVQLLQSEATISDLNALIKSSQLVFEVLFLLKKHLKGQVSILVNNRYKPDINHPYLKRSDVV